MSRPTARWLPFVLTGLVLLRCTIALAAGGRGNWRASAIAAIALALVLVFSDPRL